MNSQHGVRTKPTRRHSGDLDPLSTAQIYYGADRDPLKDHKLRAYTNVRPEGWRARYDGLIRGIGI